MRQVSAWADGAEVSALNGALQLQNQQLKHQQREIQNLMKALQRLDQANCLLESENFELRRQSNAHGQTIEQQRALIAEQRRVNSGLLLKLQKVQALEELENRANGVKTTGRSAVLEMQIVDEIDLLNLRSQVKELESENAKLRVALEKPRKKARAVSAQANELLAQAKKESELPPSVPQRAVKNALQELLDDKSEPPELKPIVCDLLPRRPVVVEMTLSEVLLRFLKTISDLPQTDLQTSQFEEENERYKTALRLEEVNSPETTYKCLAQLAQLAEFIVYDADSLSRLADGIFSGVGGLSIAQGTPTTAESALPHRFPTYEEFQFVRDDLLRLFSACVIADFKAFDKAAFIRQLAFYVERGGASLQGADLVLMACGAVEAIHNALIFVFKQDEFKGTNSVRDVFIEAVNSEYISSVYSEIFDIIVEQKQVSLFEPDLFAVDEPGFVNFSLVFGVITALEIAGGWEAIIFNFTCGKKRKWNEYAKYIDEVDLENAGDDYVLEAEYMCFETRSDVAVRGSLVEQ